MKISLFTLLLMDLAHYLQILLLLALLLSDQFLIFIDLLSILLHSYDAIFQDLLTVLYLSFQLGNFLQVHIKLFILSRDILVELGCFVLMFLSDCCQKLLDAIDAILVIHDLRQILFLGKCGLTTQQLHSLFIADILINQSPLLQFLDLSTIPLYLIHISLLQFGEFAKVDVFLYFGWGLFSNGDEIFLVDGAKATGFAGMRVAAYFRVMNHRYFTNNINRSIIALQNYKRASETYRIFCPFNGSLGLLVYGIRVQRLQSVRMADSNNNKFLPPSKAPATKYGHLTITIQGLTFFSQNKQSCVIKLQFWGSSHPLYIPLLTSETFSIVAPMNLFKTYLIDCKATQFQIVDSRNYKPIACAFLNWLPYLRALEDRQVYIDKQDHHQRDRTNIKTFYLPFYDEVVKENLPIYHFTAQNQIKRQQKVGELNVKWQCRMYEPQVQSQTASNVNSGANIYNFRVSQLTNKKNEHNPVSICNIDMQEDAQDIRTNRSILSKQRQSNSPKLYATEYPNQRRSNISIFDNYAGNLKRVRQEPQIDQSKTHITRGKNVNELDLELIRMRMEMEELVGPTSKKIEASILEIIHFQAMSKGFSSKDITYCDIRSQGKDKNSHWRVFPQSTNQEKTYFNSTLSIKPGSLLSFTLGTKKGKETYKGSMPIDCIRDSYDVNIISSAGPVFGYLRVKIERKTQINKEPTVVNAAPLNYQDLEPKKKEFMPLPPPVQKSTKEPKVPIKNESYYQSQKTKQPESYFLFNIQSIRNKNTIYAYRIFDMMIAQLNPQKIAFVSQGEFLNKPLLLIIYQHNKQIHQQILIKELKATPFTSVNLTCSLIFQKTIPELQLNCQLYAGNLKQINYYLQKLSQKQEGQQRQRQRQHISPHNQMNFPVKTQQSNKNSVIAQYQMQNLQQERRKLKTQAKGMQQRDRRLTEQKVSGQSVAMEKFQMHSENQANNEEENIYLVDLLTRFLDFLPENILSQITQMPKDIFLSILTPKLKTSSFQYELVEIIISIFQDTNGQNINIVQLMQCYKAYQSFFNIYQQQKQTIIKQILQVQPKAVQRIRNNSELGTLNDSMLWGRALSKVKDMSIKQKINKFYKISSFGSTDAALLLDDLQLKGKQLRSLDISNLGMMIKDWVEQFISHAELQKILSLKEKILNSGQQDNYLNIRSVSDVIEVTLQLRLSLWESLMLIEEIKGSYGCDLELEEGVIGGTSLLNWIDSVRKRTKLRTDNSRLSDSEVSLDPEELALIKQINQHNRNGSDVMRRESVRPSESRSMAGGANNDSDIADIANLLRQKDGLMQLELMEQTKTRHVRENRPVLPSERIIKDSLRVDSEPVQQVIFNKREKSATVSQLIPSKMEIQKENQRIPLPKEKDKKKEMKFYLQIKEFKLYDESIKLQLIKALFLLQNSFGQSSQDSFFYLTSKHNFSQANQSVIKYTIDKTAKEQHKGVKIALQDQMGKLMYSGFLPMEEINDWFASSYQNQQQCKRTIVLYEPRGKIGGKLVITLMFNNQSYEKRQQEQGSLKYNERIGITVNGVTPHLKGVKLYVRSDEKDRQQLPIGEQIQLYLHRPVYYCELIIGNEVESFTSIISLEELYLKNYLCESYPLININAGTFVATISLTLTYNLNATRKKELALNAKRQSLSPQIPQYPEQSSSKKGLISQIDGIYQSLRQKYG